MRWDPKSADFDPKCPELRILALWIRLTHNLIAIQNLLSVTQFGAIITRSGGTPEGLRRLKEFCLTIDIEPMHIDAGDNASLNAVTYALADSASRGVEAAALVFAHSITENILMDLCRILVEVAPEPWISRIATRKVVFADIRERSEKEISDELAEKFLVELGKESIVKKTEVLLSVLRSDDSGAILSGFQFKRETLEKIDLLRHECAHREIRECANKRGMRLFGV
jgi:hypothetical protein